MDVVNDILLRSFLILLWGGGIAGILVSLGMLIKPEWLIRLNQYASIWIGTEKVEERLDRPRSIERFFYRHHRITGGIFLIGSLIILYTFLISFKTQSASGFIHPDALWAMDGLVAVFIVGSVFAAIIGGVMLLRPSLLRDVESYANRWLSTDRVSKFLNRLYSFDQYLTRYGRITGVVLLILSLYVVIVLAKFVL
jgi:hypothetical protein